MNEGAEQFGTKARESLAGAESELANGRYNNAANRAYFACYQAAIVALMRTGANRRRWDHDYVQAEFSGLISRRKLYRAEMRSSLSELSVLRVKADYDIDGVSRSAADGAIKDARRFLIAILGARNG